MPFSNKPGIGVADCGEPERTPGKRPTRTIAFRPSASFRLRDYSGVIAHTWWFKKISPNQLVAPISSTWRCILTGMLRPAFGIAF